MQEEVENRTINLAISTTRLTARSIIAGIRKYLQHREKVKARKGTRDTAVHGKQSVKQLLGQNQGATNVEIDKDGIRDFERLAKKYGVDFAVRKDKSVDPPRYLVFVRSKDADALDAICKEHQARSLTKDKKPSVLAQLKKFKEVVAAIPRKVRESSKKDARLKRIVPTPKAEALRPEILEHIRDTEKRLIQGIDQEDVKICRKVLVQMIQNLAENKTENKEEDENDE